MGCTWNNLHRLPWEMKDDHWSILCCIIGSIGWQNQEETVTFEGEKKFFMVTMHHFTHRTVHRLKSMNWVSNRFRVHCILQALSDYNLFPNHQEMVVWQAFWVEQWSWMANRRVFSRVWQIILFGRYRKVDRSLDSLYERYYLYFEPSNEK